MNTYILVLGAAILSGATVLWWMSRRSSALEASYIDVINANHANAEKALAKKRDLIKALEDELALLKEMNAAVCNDYEWAKNNADSLSEEIDKANESKEYLERKVRELSADKAEMAQRVEGLAKEVSELTNANALLTGKNESLEMEIAEINGIKHKYKVLSAELRRAEDDLENCEASKKELLSLAREVVEVADNITETEKVNEEQTDKGANKWQNQKRRK